MTTDDRWQSDKYQLQKKYPEGAVIELLEIHDNTASLVPGSLGIIKCIDDAGQIHVRWQSGLLLALIPGIDSFRIVSQSAE